MGLRYPKFQIYESIPICVIFCLFFQQAGENMQEEYLLPELTLFFTEPRMERLISQRLKMVLHR